MKTKLELQTYNNTICLSFAVTSRYAASPNVQIREFLEQNIFSDSMPFQLPKQR